MEEERQELHKHGWRNPYIDRVSDLSDCIFETQNTAEGDIFNKINFK